ncbi:MAG: M1 family metallopeptidase [Bacteroidota bacterium]
MRPIQLFFIILFPAHFFSQEEPKVDFIRGRAEIRPIPSKKAISGIVRYDFRVKKQVDSIAIQAVAMEFSNIFLQNQKIDSTYTYDGHTLKIAAALGPGTYEVSLEFSTRPQQTVYFLGWEDTIEGNEQIWTQGQGKYTSHWLPSFDDMNEKVEFDLTIYFDPEYEVIANGMLQSAEMKEGLKIWRYNMQGAMSSYLVAFAIGNFDAKRLQSSSRVPIALYYTPENQSKVEPTYRHTKAIFDFLEDEVGVPYPWQDYKQVPVQDFLYAGMENTGCTIFSNSYMVDSIAFVDKNYVNINAHELAHQWFGNLVTEQSGKHHWLHEGFATYYAYLVEKKLYGEDYFYWKLLHTAKTLHNLSDNGGGEALTDPNANSLTFYEKGAWALVKLRDMVGDTAFRKAIANYLHRYRFSNAVIADFLREVEGTSKTELSDFTTKWLKGETFLWPEAKSILQDRSTSIRTYFEIVKAIDSGVQSAEAIISTYWGQITSYHLKRQLVLDYGKTWDTGFVRQVLADAHVLVRQAMVLSLDDFPEALKTDLLDLLDDESYITQEAVLYRLWNSFPEERTALLNKTADRVGLPNKNIKLLWLTLALVTPEYRSESKYELLAVLRDFTATHHHFEIRQLAFQYLYQIRALDDGVLKNLISATAHHVWQFKKSSKNLLKEFLKDKDKLEQLRKRYGSFSEKERQIIEKLTAN